MFNRNTSKLMALGFALVVLVSGFSIALAAGGVAATDTDASVLVHEETAIDNSTSSVYADVTGANTTVMNGSGPIAVNVTVTGLTEGQSVENGTVLSSEQLSVSAGNVSSFSYSLTDTETTDYDSVHTEVNVVTSGEEQYIESVNWGVLGDISGGGGGLLSGSVGGVPVLGVLVVVGAYFVLGRD